MKIRLTLFFFLLSSPATWAQPEEKLLYGAWELIEEEGTRTILTLSQGFFARATFHPGKNEFIHTVGGKWSLIDDQWKAEIEFDTRETTKVGTSVERELEISGDQLGFKNPNEVWKKIDDNTPGELAGAWIITGRERNGKMNQRRPGPRKTMKILSGTRFQWIAYHTETGEFFGTGGGTYTTSKGTYTENIEFFSRDASRVGASLSFAFSLEQGNWHHRGKSSKGDPIYEIWSKR